MMPAGAGGVTLLLRMEACGLRCKAGGGAMVAMAPRGVQFQVLQVSWPLRFAISRPRQLEVFSVVRL